MNPRTSPTKKRFNNLMNYVRYALFILITTCLATTSRSPKATAMPDDAPALISLPQYKVETGIVKADVNLYGQYKHDTQDLAVPADAVQAQNAEVFANLHKLKPRETAGRATAIDQEAAERILAFTTSHPVVGMKKLADYDPKKCIGFCFGRAMFIHLELLARGINKDSIRKAYVVGEMHYEGIVWGFHVATVVKSTDGGWLVIDPEFDKVVSIEEWYKINFELSKNKQLRLYITEANKFGASAPKYDSATLANEWYSRYFADVLQFFRTRELKSIRKIGVTPVCRDLFQL